MALRPCWLTEGLKPSIINGGNGGTSHINLLKMSFHFLESRLSHGLANLEAREVRELPSCDLSEVLGE